jgi:hypothetical protein
MVPFAQHVEIRRIGPGPFEGGDRAELLAWVRWVDRDAPVDAVSLVILVDALAPALYAVATNPVPIPTVDLTVTLQPSRRPEGGPSSASAPEPPPTDGASTTATCGRRTGASLRRRGRPAACSVRSGVAPRCLTSRRGQPRQSRHTREQRADLREVAIHRDASQHSARGAAAHCARSFGRASSGRLRLGLPRRWRAPSARRTALSARECPRAGTRPLGDCTRPGASPCIASLGQPSGVCSPAARLWIGRAYNRGHCTDARMHERNPSDPWACQPPTPSGATSGRDNPPDTATGRSAPQGVPVGV